MDKAVWNRWELAKCADCNFHCQSLPLSDGHCWLGQFDVNRVIKNKQTVTLKMTIRAQRQQAPVPVCLVEPVCVMLPNTANNGSWSNEYIMPRNFMQLKLFTSYHINASQSFENIIEPVKCTEWTSATGNGFVLATAKLKPIQGVPKVRRILDSFT